MPAFTPVNPERRRKPADHDGINIFEDEVDIQCNGENNTEENDEWLDLGLSDTACDEPMIRPLPESDERSNNPWEDSIDVADLYGYTGVEEKKSSADRSWDGSRTSARNDAHKVRKVRKAKHQSRQHFERCHDVLTRAPHYHAKDQQEILQGWLGEQSSFNPDPRTGAESAFISRPSPLHFKGYATTAFDLPTRPDSTTITDNSQLGRNGSSSEGTISSNLPVTQETIYTLSKHDPICHQSLPSPPLSSDDSLRTSSVTSANEIPAEKPKTSVLPSVEGDVEHVDFYTNRPILDLKFRLIEPGISRALLRKELPSLLSASLSPPLPIAYSNDEDSLLMTRPAFVGAANDTNEPEAESLEDKRQKEYEEEAKSNWKAAVVPTDTPATFTRIVVLRAATRLAKMHTRKLERKVSFDDRAARQTLAEWKGVEFDDEQRFTGCD